MSDVTGTVEAAVREALRQVLEGKGLQAEDLGRERHLTTDLGLRSLDLAQLVALLEFSLQADPFARLVSVTDVRTVGDLCVAYEKCLAAEGTVAPQDAEPWTPTGRSASTTGEVRRRARGDAP